MIVIIIAFVFFIISMVIIANAFMKILDFTTGELKATKYSLETAEKSICILEQKGPVYEYIYPKSVLLQQQTIVDAGTFTNDDYRKHIINEMGLSIGQELAQKKLIKFDIQKVSTPTSQTQYNIIAKIKIVDDKSN